MVAGQATAADDPVQKAMKSYEKHRYEDAVRDLRAALPSLTSDKRSQGQLVLGMIYLRSAIMHRGLAALSAEVNGDYLKRLSVQRGSGRSQYSELYRGLAELERGRPDRAEAAFRTFIAATRDARAAARARIGQGRAAVAKQRRQEAADLWAGVGANDLDVRAALADALSEAGQRDREPTALCEAVVTDPRGGGTPLPIDVVTACLAVYARTGEVNRGASLLERADLKDHAFRETQGKSKELFFYDVRLLSNLATFAMTAGIAALESAARDPQVGNVANYYLGEAYLVAGNKEAAAKATAAFLASPQAPPQYRNRALVRQAEIQYLKGKRSDAIAAWEDLARNQQKEPALLADIVGTCGRLAIDCPRPVQAAVIAAATGEGRRFAAVNIALGEYYLGRKDIQRALTYFEAGRDKGNKNKIEFNDPDMLIALANGYYRTKKYSEALEIFFEMSKQFPQVRQIQEALQGIYSMEHKSAGDVKIN
jgi:tetratricopeptide (TPR) repeat protein